MLEALQSPGHGGAYLQNALQSVTDEHPCPSGAWTGHPREHAQGTAGPSTSLGMTRRGVFWARLYCRALLGWADPSTSLGAGLGVPLLGRGGACTSGTLAPTLSIPSFRKNAKGGHPLEHGVGVRRCRRDGLEDIPVLHDFSVLVQTKNIHPGPV